MRGPHPTATTAGEANGAEGHRKSTPSEEHGEPCKYAKRRRPGPSGQGSERSHPGWITGPRKLGGGDRTLPWGQESQ